MVNSLRRIAASNSRNAVNFSSARTTKRFPSPRCASAIQIVRPSESIADTQTKLFRDTPGEKNMARVAAIHHPLRHVDSRSRYVRAVVNIDNPAYWTAMDTHPHAQFRMTLKPLADFQSTLNRCIRGGGKCERHPVSGWQADQFAGRFRNTEGFSGSDDLIELLE